MRDPGMTAACRGEVWLVDLGLAAKIRPCLVMSVPTEDADRVLVTVVPHTTALRGSRFEVTVSARYLKAGGFDAQGIVTIPAVRLIRRLWRSHCRTDEVGRGGTVIVVGHWIRLARTRRTRGRLSRAAFIDALSKKGGI